MKTEMNTTKGQGKGHYQATPLTFMVGNTEYTYSGRGRHSTQLSMAIVQSKTFPVTQDDGTWNWRTATAEELASAQKLVDKAEAKVTARETAKAARLEAKAVKAAAKAQAKADAKAAKAQAKAAVEVPATVPVEVADQVTA
jgi:hypothetical protein